MFDLSKLQRRKPDMTTVVRPKFLFQGWELRWVSNIQWDAPPSIADFNVRRTTAVEIILPRKDDFSIIVKLHEGAYCFTGPRIVAPYPIPVPVPITASFDSIVSETEKYILRTISANGGALGDMLMPRDRSFHNRRVFEEYVDKCVAVWRDPNALVSQ